MTNDPVVFLSIYLREQRDDYLAWDMYMDFQNVYLVRKGISNHIF